MNHHHHQRLSAGARRGVNRSRRASALPSLAFLGGFARRTSVAPFHHEVRFWLLAAWLCLVFALGGSSRPDTQSLAVLRPLSVLVTFAGFWTLTKEQAKRLRGTFAFVTAIIILIALHLVPLPPSWWSNLPGRGLIVEIDRTVGISGTWRPISISPPWTWNALWFMFTPLSVLVLIAQLDMLQVRKLSGVVLLIGLASGVLAIAQVGGDPQGLLYFYRFTHFGTAVGLFANRNHQAVFLALLIPIAMVWLRHNPLRLNLDRGSERQINLTRPGVLVLVCTIFPLILASGSRSGLVALIVSVPVSIAFLQPLARTSRVQRSLMGKKFLVWLGLAIISLLAVTSIALNNDRALSIDRFVEVDPLEDMRARILPTVFTMIRMYAPLGSGVGTFEPVYQIHEPDELLIPTYANHIHNDWLEIALTAGIPGVIWLASMVVAWFACFCLCLSAKARQERPAHELAVAGLIATFLLGMASVSDYPLRTPSLSALLIVMLVWINLGLSSVASYRRAEDAG